MSHYDTLGVSADASKDDIKRAYRKKAHKAHPDKGGDPEKFYPIQRAYETLKDDARRAHYDKTGADTGSQELDIRRVAMGELGNLFIKALNELDFEHMNVVAEVRGFIDKQTNKETTSIQDTRKYIVKREKAIKRIKFKGDGPNVLEQMILGDIRSKQRVIYEAEWRIEICKEVLKLLKDYDYQADPMTPQAQAATFQKVARGMGWNIR